LRQTLDLGHQGAGRVDQLQPRGGGLAREMGAHAVGGDRHAPEPAAGGFGDRRRALDAALTQALDDLRIVDDVADRGDRTGALGRGGDDLERAPNSPTVAQLLGDHDAPGGLRLKVRRCGAIDRGGKTGGRQAIVPHVDTSMWQGRCPLGNTQHQTKV
jgi:hypothetical protein